MELVPVVLVLLCWSPAAWRRGCTSSSTGPTNRPTPASPQAVVRAASDGTVALLSYSPDIAGHRISPLRGRTWPGDFLSYYDHFTQQIVAPAAKQKSLKTTARVMGAAVSELRPDSAVVLLFVDQTTTSKDSPEPAMAASSVLVSMTRVNGNWLITKFDPI